MTPLPSSTTIPEQVTSASTFPIWFAPMLTGMFVLLAALIALASLWLSDRRKLAREDRRQWDFALREAYVTVAQLVRKAQRAHYRFEGGLERVAQGTDRLFGFDIADSATELSDVADKAGPKLRDLAAFLSLTAPTAVLVELNEITDLVDLAPDHGWNHDEFPEDQFLSYRSRLDAALSRFRDAVREALRTASRRRWLRPRSRV